jgi:formamidopyrimidine-DNA glycosylase
MPELPEVETIVRDLASALPGSTVGDVEVLRPDLIEGSSPGQFRACVAGNRVLQVTRRAKNIVIDIGDDRLVVNLGMTGRLLVVPAGSELPPHLGVRFALEDGRMLLYQDVRRFGRLECMPADEWARRDAELGVEPLAPGLSAKAVRQMMGGSRVAIKVWLMDQRRIVGIGNIYANEALFRARLDPSRPANAVTAREAARLLGAIQDVLREAIEFRGTTLLDYRDASGEPGEFAKRLRVYDREGEPCPGCGQPIQRIVQGGRSSFHCPRCQR